MEEMTNLNTKNTVIRDVIKHLNYFQINHGTEFRAACVKGHALITGNELADY